MTGSVLPTRGRGPSLAAAAAAVMAVFAVQASAQEPTAPKASPPNVVLIMADDLGFGEVGVYGQQHIRTPRIDEMARGGLAFTQFYAGATVCAPSRYVLMTGRHNGHSHVRGNAGKDDRLRQSLREEDYTIAECFKERGYDTACIGKWGLGEIGEPGHPNLQGFDLFYGYLNQTHAHNYYPASLIRNSAVEPLRNEVVFANAERGDVGGGYSTNRLDYSHDLFIEQAVQFLTMPRDNPFFLYLPLTVPHGNNESLRMIQQGSEVPSVSPYAEAAWDEETKRHAAMITRMDEGVGRVLDHLARLGLEDNTLVIFTSDNGPHREANHDVEMLDPSGPLRGFKRALYEGGIRVPTICYWPGVIPPQSLSDHIAYHGDFFATLAELTGPPVDPSRGPIDSLSFASLLSSAPTEKPQPEHEYLYWEFYEQGSRQAVRFGDWKAIREPMLAGTVELYNLAEDIGEDHDVAAENPEVVAKAIAYMDEAHVPHPNWPVPKAKKR